MLSFFKSFEPATLTISAEKKPIPITVKNDANAHANDAALRALII